MDQAITFCYFKDRFGYVAEYTSDIDIADESKHQPRVWPQLRIHGSLGVAAPPSENYGKPWQGEPDHGWLMSE
jgi:hypothetical protein